MRASGAQSRHARTGEGQPCLVVALVGSAHGGLRDTALRMIEAAFKMGADAIQFQIFRADALVVRRHPERKELDARGDLGRADWQEVLKAARASGLPCVVEVFDRRLPRPRARSGGGRPPGPPHRPREPRSAPRGGGRRTGPSCSRRGRRPRRRWCARPLDRSPARERRRSSSARRRARARGGDAAPELAALEERHGLPRGVPRRRPTAGRAFALLAPALAAAHGAAFVEKRFTLDRSRKGHDYDGRALSRGLLPHGRAAAAGGARARATPRRPRRRRRRAAARRGPLHRRGHAHRTRRRC